MPYNKTSPLANLPRLRDVTTKRESSWDRTGGNRDFIVVQPGATATLADLHGAGCINHIWCTMAGREEHVFRKVLLRAWWDGEPRPSIETPIGDFFGMGHAQSRNFVSAPFTMSPDYGRGFNCWLPMPFAGRARFEIQSECGEHPLNFYYYIDYELYDSLGGELGRLHAQWRRQNPCDGIADSGMSNTAFQFEGENLSGAGNYVILEAEGRGHYIGCHLDIENLRRSGQFDWYGEGDDMIFIDGEPFPPSLHGTGTEDYFSGAYCPTQEYNAPYHGIILPGGPNWSGKVSLYRYHVEDPIHFRKSIKVTIEHGHANHRSDDYSSTAYWYQAEPHAPFPSLPGVAGRLPR